MANELKLTYTGATPVTLVGLIQNATGQFYNTGTTAFETFNASNVANYAATTLTQIGSTSEYLGSMPTSISTAGRYRILVYTKASSTLATSDLVGSSFVGSDQIEWKGSAELSNAADINAGVGANFTAIGSISSTVSSLSSSLAGVSSTLGTMSGYVGGLVTSVGSVSTAVGGIPAGVVTAMKTDTFLLKTFARSMGKFSFNASTSVMTLFEDDGVTVIGTVTIAASSGTITART